MKILLTLILSFFLFSEAGAATYWASVAGGAGNCAAASGASDPGTYRTLTQGLACLAAADTLILKSGTYNQSIPANSIISGTSPAARTTIRSETPLAAIIRPTVVGTCNYSLELVSFQNGQNNITIDGLTLDLNNVCQNGIIFHNDIGTPANQISYIEIKNSAIKNSGAAPAVANTMIIGDYPPPGSGPFATFHHIDLTNNEIYEIALGNSCVSVDPNDSVWSGNYVHDCGNHGMTSHHVASQTGLIVRNNTIKNAAAGCFQFVNEAVVYNNICINTGGGPYGDGSGNHWTFGAFDQYVSNDPGNSANVRYFSNTSYGRYQTNGVSRPCYAFSRWISGGGNQFRNNICYGDAGGDNIVIDTFSGGSTTVSNNRCNGANCAVTSDPLLANAAAGDFHLLPGSPAINAGATLGSPYNVDYAGNLRTVPYDIGAYELPAMFYFSSTGSGTRAGTGCADTSNLTRCPFSQLSTLVAGDTGVIKNGTHVLSSPIAISGLNGTSGAPITLRAETERQAWLQGNGLTHFITILNSSNIAIQGLRISGPLALSATGIDISNSTNIIIRRLLMHSVSDPASTDNNCIYLYNGSQGGLLEENEFYDYNHNCMTADSTNGHMFRRNYGNQRGFATLGDLVALYAAGSNNIIENNIAEGQADFAAISYGSTSNNQFLGNISIGGAAARVSCRQAGTITNNVIENNVSLGGLYGFNNEGQGTTITSNISYGATSGWGLIQYLDTGNFPACTGQTLSSTGSNNLMVNGTDVNYFGFDMRSPGTFSFQKSNAFNNAGGNFNPGIGNAGWNGTATQTNPALGACRIYIPAGSPMKGAGVGGADIGANVLYQYVNGSLTSTLLWDFTQTGANRGQWIARGATVAGVNDIAGSSLMDVHQRLGFGNNPCPSPGVPVAGYVFTQTHSQFYSLRDSGSTVVLKGPQDGDTTIQPNGSIRIRIKISCSTNECPAMVPFLYYSRNGASWLITQNVPDINHIGLAGLADLDSQIPSDGAFTSELLTSDFTTNVSGRYIRISNAVPSIDLSLNSEVEMEYLLSMSGGQVGDTYDFRIYDAINPLNAYQVTPRLTVVNPELQVTGF